MDSDPLIPSERDGMSTAEPKVRPGRGWKILHNHGLAPEDERNPAVAGLHQLADVEALAHWNAIRKKRRAVLLGTVGTVLTLVALVLAAAAGFGSLNDLVSQRAAAMIALSSAVASAISAFVQSKSNGDALRAEAQAWTRQADDVLDSLVDIVSHLPMKTSDLRVRTSEALFQARDREPGRLSNVNGSPAAK